MRKRTALVFMAAAAMLALAAVHPGNETPERSIGIRIRADSTRVRVLDDGFLFKEYAGNVRIWNRSLSLKSMRAVLRSDSGMVRLYGVPERQHTAGARGVPEGRVQAILLDSRGKRKLTMEARAASLYGHRGAADSILAEGAVVIRWTSRKAKAEAQQVRWIAFKREIYADSVVVLTMDDLVERGKSFRARDDLAWYTMRKVTGSMRNPGPGKRKE